MKKRAARIVDAFDLQLRVYDRVLSLARREKEALQRRRPLGEIVELLKEKRESMREIENINRRMARERVMMNADGELLDIETAAMLNDKIAALKRVMEEIMAVERENEDIILSAGSYTVPTRG